MRWIFPTLLAASFAVTSCLPSMQSSKPPVPAPLSGATASATVDTTSTLPAQPATPCIGSSGSPGKYSATICITAPAGEATLTGDAPITATVFVQGYSPGVQHVRFYLDGKVLLDDFTKPYQFTLPTSQYLDGPHALSAEALLRDQYVTSQAHIPLTFHTGTTALPADTKQFQPTSGSAPAAGQPLVVAAVGDGAGGDPSEEQVVSQISSWNPNLFLYLGDVYEQGSIAEFYNWYRPDNMFGKFKSITDPTVGNHEYIQGNDAPYRAYWDNVPDYYSYDAQGWHFISLNSNSSKIGVGPDSTQYQWLQSDLAADQSKCTIVYFHHPYFSIGKEGSTAALADIWKLMAQYHVTIVLNGHDHEYQRWTPLNADGQPDPTGITEFVVGTGGHSLTEFVTSDARVAASKQKVFGALRLNLNPDSADFSYMSADGTQIDSGNVACQGGQP